jgi:hypothetical protein
MYTRDELGGYMYPDNAFQPTGGKHNPFNRSMKLWGGGKGGGSAPNPNPGMIRAAEASEKVGMRQAEIAEDTLSFYKQQYADMKPLLEQITKSEMDTMAANQKRADEYAEYERSTFRPVEQRLVKDAEEYSTVANQEKLASAAASDLSQAYSNTRDQSNRSLSRLGVNPNSNRFAALNNQLSLDQAANTAGAMTKARSDADNLGFARRMDVTGLGRGLATNASTAYGVSINAGNSAAANAQAGGDFMGRGFNTASGIYGGASNAYGTSGSIYGNEFNARMQGYNAQQEAAGGFWKGMGALAGGVASGGTGSIGGALATRFLADGGSALEKKGAISGPGGPVDDKIPAMLSDGEYVLPADTVKAIGKNKLDKVVAETHTPAAVQRQRKALKGKR